MSLQRIALTIATVAIIGIGLVLAATSWPVPREMMYVTCDPLAGACTTITRPYKTGSEVGVLFGVFLAVFGLIVLTLILSQYVKYIFTAALKRLKKLMHL